MSKNYEAPQIEVIEIEIEDVLCTSGSTTTTTESAATVTSFSSNGRGW